MLITTTRLLETTEYNLAYKTPILPLRKNWLRKLKCRDIFYFEFFVWTENQALITLPQKRSDLNNNI